MTERFLKRQENKEIEHTTRRGTMRLFTGCMFSGKTDKFVTEVLVLQKYAKKKVQIFNPAINNRAGINKIDAHNGKFLDALAVSSSEELLSLVKGDSDIVAIEEIQFFDSGIVAVTQKILDKGIKIIGAGLDLNFRGEPFGPMPELLTYAEKVTKLKARCVICGHKATRTQRVKIINGERVPAHYDDPLVLIGAEQDYEARCSTCFKCPRD